MRTELYRYKMMNLKSLKRRIFPDRRDIGKAKKIVSDFLHRRNPFAGIILKKLFLRYFLGDAVRHVVEVEKNVSEPLPLYHTTFSSVTDYPGQNAAP